MQLFEFVLNPSLCASTAAPHRFVTSHHETNNQSIDSSDGLIAEGVCKCQDDMTRTTGGLIDTPQSLQALRTKSTNPVSQISSWQFTPIEIVLHAIEGCPHYRQLLSPHHQNPQNPYQITIQQIQQHSHKTNNTDTNPIKNSKVAIKTYILILPCVSIFSRSKSLSVSCLFRRTC